MCEFLPFRAELNIAALWWAVVLAATFFAGLGVGMVFEKGLSESPLFTAWSAQLHRAFYPDQHRMAAQAVDWGKNSIAVLVQGAVTSVLASAVPLALSR